MAWAGWTLRGGPLDGDIPAVGSNADGRLEVFSGGEGQNGTELWHIWQTAPNGWSAWNSLGGEPANSAGIGHKADGSLTIFVEGRTINGPASPLGAIAAQQRAK
jgi:hypothetical protein